MVQASIEFHPDAIVEARTARLWYADRSDSAAEAFVNELDVAIERITSAPESCPVYLHRTRRYLLKRFPYVVVFREKLSHLQVVAVAHGRRMPGYWKSRVK